jgi:RNA polymerase sigma-70 factor (ECF subfamily)
LSQRELDPQSLGDHLDRLYRAGLALTGNRQDAEDLVQETYLKVLKRPRILRNEDDLGYLLRALRNTFFSRIRSAGRRPEDLLPPEEMEVPDSAAGPEGALEAREVLEMVGSLPEEYRDAIVAVDVVGLSYSEAARALRIKEPALTTRLYRGRQQVAKRLRPA